MFFRGSSRRSFFFSAIRVKAFSPVSGAGVKTLWKNLAIWLSSLYEIQNPLSSVFLDTYAVKVFSFAIILISLLSPG
jgi:hypothetical protein